MDDKKAIELLEKCRKSLKAAEGMGDMRGVRAALISVIEGFFPTRKALAKEVSKFDVAIDLHSESEKGAYETVINSLLAELKPTGADK